MPDLDPWLTIDAALRWIGERSDLAMKRRTLLREIRRAASQEGRLLLSRRHRVTTACPEPNPAET